MEYAHLQMNSSMIEFLSGPLTRDLTVLPGCGPAGVKALGAADIFTMDQLCGKFMTFDRDPTLMVQWYVMLSFVPRVIHSLTESFGGQAGGNQVCVWMVRDSHTCARSKAPVSTRLVTNYPRVQERCNALRIDSLYIKMMCHHCMGHFP